MDFGRNAGSSGGNVGLITVPEIPGSSNGFDQWVPGSNDQSIWATEDDYNRAWNMGPSTETPSSFSYDDRPNRFQSGSEPPPNKKSRNSQCGDSHMIVNYRSKAIGKMFFKTKMCCKFRAGVCPYVTNCNFAHGMEELRKPPFNWQEIAAAHEEGHVGVTLEPREEHQIPTFSSSDFRGESQRSYKGRHCKRFYTDEGCPYGDHCTFLHDEQSRARESVAISLSPTVGGEHGNGGSTLNLKPSNWKTRICNKWETTGHCPFGTKCHFAHGLGELHKHSGGPVEAEGMESSLSTPTDSNQGGVPSKRMTDMVVASTPSNPHTDVYHMGLGVPSQRLALNSGLTRRLGVTSLQKWKGPDKISRIYGDWIDDIE